jgi:beta-lactamase class A
LESKVITRRTMTAYLPAVLCIGIALCVASILPALRASGRHNSAETRLRELEFAARGRLGVHIIDTGTGHTNGYRADKRFMRLSTFKLQASAVAISRVDAGSEALQRRVNYTKKNLVTHSKMTERFAGDEGMTRSQLCEETLTTSDNTAANLTLAGYGSPSIVTALARKTGDRVARLDRIEIEINAKYANGMLDITSPRAIAMSGQNWYWAMRHLRRRGRVCSNGWRLTRPAANG